MLRAPLVQIKQIERKRPMTRTLSTKSFYTKKEKPMEDASPIYSSAPVQAKSMGALFSLYNPAPKTLPPTARPRPTTRRPIETRGALNLSRYSNFYDPSKLSPLYRTHKPSTTHAPYIYQARYTTAEPTVKPRMFNSLYSKLRQLKSNPKPVNALPAGFNLQAELEKMKTTNFPQNSTVYFSIFSL